MLFCLCLGVEWRAVGDCQWGSNISTELAGAAAASDGVAARRGDAGRRRSFPDWRVPLHCAEVAHSIITGFLLTEQD